MKILSLVFAVVLCVGATACARNKKAQPSPAPEVAPAKDPGSAVSMKVHYETQLLGVNAVFDQIKGKIDRKEEVSIEIRKSLVNLLSDTNSLERFEPQVYEVAQEHMTFGKTCEKLPLVGLNQVALSLLPQKLVSANVWLLTDEKSTSAFPAGSLAFYGKEKASATTEVKFLNKEYTADETKLASKIVLENGSTKFPVEKAKETLAALKPTLAYEMDQKLLYKDFAVSVEANAPGCSQSENPHYFIVSLGSRGLHKDHVEGVKAMRYSLSRAIDWLKLSYEESVQPITETELNFYRQLIAEAFVKLK